MEVRNSLDYYVLDVFTQESYKGNPLSVVFTNGDLSLTEYENISREFGYSETSFVYYSIEQKMLHVRSFTPIGVEVGGAGHNLLGAVSGALLKGLISEHTLSLTVLMENTPIAITIDNPTQGLPVVKMRQKPVQIGQELAFDLLAKALGLSEKDLIVRQLIPTIAQTEVAHAMIPVSSINLLNSIKPNANALIELSKQFDFEGFYCFAFPESTESYIVQSRFFNPLIGIDEDAATGTAAGPLAGFLCNSKVIQQGQESQILQGVKLNQPSLINVVVKEDGIYVGGSSVVTMQGVVYL
ncbi:PhzF family phenazine biosynthesis protein [Cytophagaceae bacterium DM2B3-1]|uniref:PhzF family phenazine biosynthesis protein n=1 Tax=Xanthocytophaga flava TaxID=3048013 RepID=A0ABT7CS45_9BACT|nr:PhzF family phenazine biosynthesis protein [Xanthocytophaga flavus]MDJ1496573.1 PhzF family phenazine biosynthesis protein [Xanthocytophaga flavus]